MNNEVKFLLRLLSPLYKVPKIDRVDINKIDVERLLELAKVNNLLFYTCKLLKDRYEESISPKIMVTIKEVLKNGEGEFKKMKSGIKVLDRALGDHLLIKTYRGYPRIANDLDVLVDNYKLACASLSQAKLAAYDGDDRLQEIVYKSKSTVKLHIHGKIGWLNRDYFDEDLVWERPRRVTISDRKVLIPNYTLDFLIHMAHINFEPLHFTLSDLLYIFRISGKVNWEVVYQQSGKYRWQWALVQTLCIMDQFHRKIYATPANFNGIKMIERRRVSYQLPYTLPRYQIVRAFLQKGVIVEPILKLPKVLKVLVSSDSYSGFYQPPERIIKK